MITALLGAALRGIVRVWAVLSCLAMEAVRRAFRHRLRQVTMVTVLGVCAVAMLVGAGTVADDYWQDLLLNLGASLVLVVASYAVFDSVFEELRTGRVVEHASLDRDLCIRRFAESHSVITIMETWTGLLEEPFTTRFLDVLHDVIARGVHVRILLLHPDSAAAADRTRELSRHGRRQSPVDVAREIEANLLHLNRFVDDRLPERLRGRLEVRITPNMPSVQLYRWDQKALISFFPTSELAYDSGQLEVYMNTPWGRFVDEDFEQNWAAPDTIDLASYMRLGLRITEQGEQAVDVAAEFVMLDGRRYISTAGLSFILGRFDDVTLTVAAGTEPCRFAVVTREELELVAAKFRRKYGAGRDTFLRLSYDES